MTAEITTPPLCRSCGNPRKRRAKQPGWRGGNGWCDACYTRWRAAGKPPEGPPPPVPAAESGARSNAVPRGPRETRTVPLSRAALSWHERAACRGMDADVFFPVGTITDEEAKATCARCPVRTQCLDYAIARPEKYGTWGGLGEVERDKERRRRMRRGEVAA